MAKIESKHDGKVLVNEGYMYIFEINLVLTVKNHFRGVSTMRSLLLLLKINQLNIFYFNVY